MNFLQTWRRRVGVGLLTLVLGCMEGLAQGHAPFQVLVFSKTAGFRHDSIPDAIAAVKAMAATNDFTVEATEDAAQFTSANLARFQAVIFLLTTGDVLDSAQQSALQGYIEGGGGFVGVHSASDTEHAWSWYGGLVGAYFKSHPAIQPGTVLVNDAVDGSTRGLPRRWDRTDEWYSFNLNPRGMVHVLATLDEKSYAPSDAMAGAPPYDHPISWFQKYDGGRSWYTAMGHTIASYHEPLFLQHLLGGILWAAGAVAGDPGSTLDKNFQKVVLDNAPKDPLQLTIARDGRVLFIERGGKVKIWKPDTRSTVTAGALAIDEGREDGLLGIALDPGFATNGWLYLFYSPAGTNSEQHVSRFHMSGDTLDPASEKVLIKIPTQRLQCCHSAGGLLMAPQGDLFISVGDNTNPFESSSFAPLDQRPGRSPWDSEKSASNTDDLRGKILRIHPNADGSYSIPAGNLFPPGTALTRPEIYTMGNRNPYRTGYDPATGWLYWGEVGPDAYNDDASRGPRGYDEWNQARSAGNYGWPYFVGNNFAYHAYDFATGVSGAAFDPARPVNTSPNNTGLSALPPARPAWIWYPYADSPDFPEVNGAGGRTAMGGPIYHFDPAVKSPGKLPAYYDKTLFIYEWSRGFAREVKMDEQGNLLKINPFLPTFAFNRPIDMEIGPDGRLYVIEWGSQFGGGNADAVVERIDYVGGNHPPVASASVDIDNGGAPLTVHFSSAGAYSPDKVPVAFAWSFTGNGHVDSTDPNPVFTYVKPGDYTAQLVVTDANGNSSVANLAITVGNHRPVVSVAQPRSGGVFDWNSAIRFEGAVADVEDGSTAGGGIPCTNLLWTLDIGHNTHSHNIAAAGACSGVFSTPPGHGGDGDNIFLVLSGAYTDRGAPGVAPLTGAQTLVFQPRLKQAEHYTRSSGITNAPTQDDNGVEDVAGISDGSWISVQPMSLAGVEALTFRVEGRAGGRIEIRENGPAGFLLGTADVPATTVGYANVVAKVTDLRALAPQTIEMFLVFRASGGATGDLMALNWIRFEGPGVSIAHRPYHGFAAPIPGRIEAEQMDGGGDGVSWHNPGQASVALDSADSPSGGSAVTDLAAGEWLDYTVDVETPGAYKVALAVVSDAPGAECHVEVDDIDKTGPLALPVSPAPHWTRVVKDGVNLDAGVHRVRVMIDETGGGAGAGRRLDYIQWTLTQANVPPSISLVSPPDGATYSAPASVPVAAAAIDPDGQVAEVEFFNGADDVATFTAAPFGGAWTNVPAGDYHLHARAVDNQGGSAETAAVAVHVVNGVAPYLGLPKILPGAVQAEDFDEGGEDVAYSDTDPTNDGGKYRATGVDIGPCSDTGGGFNVGWTAAGEWLKYSVLAGVGGLYKVEFRVASQGVAGTFHLEVDGADVTGPMSPGDTGGWQTWRTLVKTNIAIAAGPHVLRLAEDGNGANGTVGNYNWYRFTATQTNAPPPSVEWAAALAGPFAPETAASLDLVNRRFRLPEPVSARFYRVRTPAAVRITSLRRENGGLVIEYR